MLIKNYLYTAILDTIRGYNADEAQQEKSVDILFCAKSRLYCYTPFGIACPWLSRVFDPFAENEETFLFQIYTIFYTSTVYSSYLHIAQTVEST